MYIKECGITHSGNRMKRLEYLKRLWNKAEYDDQRDKIIDAAAETGDPETLEWFWDVAEYDDQRDKIFDKLLSFKNQKRNKLPYSKSSSLTKTTKDLEHDCFICHASEDKESFVRELAITLSNKGLKVWYDEFTLTLGDSLRRKIDYGLANSRYGIVVLSKYFFEKKWPQDELDGLVARERLGKKIILPIWHGVTREDVERFSPILAGRVAVSTHKGLDYVVREIIRAIKHS